MLFYPKEGTLKILCCYLNWKCVKKGGQEGVYLEDVWGFLTGLLKDRVILEAMDDLGKVQGSYPEGFVALSLFLAEIYKFVVLVKKRDTQTEYRIALRWGTVCRP